MKDKLPYKLIIKQVNTTNTRVRHVHLTASEYASWAERLDKQVNGQVLLEIRPDYD